MRVLRKKIHFAIIACISLMSCNSSSDNETPLYQSEAFTVYNDKVIQGENEAQVLSPTKMTSNYKSLESETYSRLLLFKFSINEKDNELPVGVDHRLAIGEEHESPVITFGRRDSSTPETPKSYLPVNYEYTFRVDMSEVFDQFERWGNYRAADGSRIAKDDFKGVYLAGASDPLTWDFVNLANKGLMLTDPDGDKVYELKVILNPYDPSNYEDKTWELTQDISSKPSYTSDQPIVDALFNLSLEEAMLNIEKDSTLRTGAKWGGVWTRDVSYSILLAFAYHEPEVAKISLMKKVKRDRIVQDTGSGGAWPVSSDRTTWALAAWEVYKTTGDMSWLRRTYTILKNTLEDDNKTLLSPTTGMYRGESSFLDWREQTYPKWMSNMDIYTSENLGTNVVHYQAHIILSQMAKQLGEPYEKYEERASAINTGINRHLWLSKQGYYAQYLYGRTDLNVSPRFEALGEALAVLFDVASPERANSIMANSPVTPYGTTCIYPQIPNIPPYHNNGIWPFVQSYWNWAAAKAGNEEALVHGLGSIYRAGGLFLTNYENFVADNGDFMGTEINSHRMLWSMAGNLAMVHRIFIGMSFEVDGLSFSPVIPEAYGGERKLSNFKYRNAVLDITVYGHGNQIAGFKLDGKAVQPFLPSDISGRHSVEIQMRNNDFSGKGIHLVENAFSLPNPRAQLQGNTLSWEPIEGAVGYRLYKDGKEMEMLKEARYEVPTEEEQKFAEYKVTAVDKAGVESFTSEPIRIVDKKEVFELDMTAFALKSRKPYVNYSGRGFIEVSTEENKEVSLVFNAPARGKYLVDLRYSNGTGPWNTDNNCAIRSLYANDEYQGVLVFPQRGTNEWSDWGYSNMHIVEMKKGKNVLKVVYNQWNTNMDVEVNTAMLDFMRVVRYQ